MRLKLFILISTFVLCKISFAQKNSLADEPLAFTGALIYPAPGEEPIKNGVVVGVIKKGMDADLVVLDGDPAQDINAFSHVAMTVREGRIIYPSISE